MTIKGNPENLKFERKLRSTMTEPERRLWGKLRTRQFHGCKFRRQHGIGPYIVDFFCPEKSFVIEIDGETHGENVQIQSDIDRDIYLVSLGLKVARYRNADVMKNIEGVLEDLELQMSDPGAPPLCKGRLGGVGDHGLPTSPDPSPPNNRRASLQRRGDLGNLVIQKYGGTSVAGVERINSVADRIRGNLENGDRIVVVLSAMGDDTDRLVDMAKDISENPDPRDMDLLLATGEQTSIAMLSLALKARGVKCETFLGHQAGIITDDNHGRARIVRIDAGRVRLALEDGKVAIVAGFQGATEGGAITTIGRGGSDTTAVALAAALRANRCEIFSDVDGVYTADPEICPNARLLERVTYEEMMELSDAGARVLHDRCVELAAKHKVPLVVKSSFTEGRGTAIVSEESMEGAVVSGITCDTDEAKVSVRRVPDRVGVTAGIFAPIARAGIDVDLIVQTVSEEGFTELSFTVPKDDLRRALTLAEAAAKKVCAGKVSAAGDIAKISIVGLGMRAHAGIAHRMFEALAREDISIQMIGTSEIKVSIVINMKHARHAVRVLHKEFELDRQRERR